MSFNFNSQLAELAKQAYKQIKVVGITSPGIEEILLSDGTLINRSDLPRRVLLALYEISLTGKEDLRAIFQNGEVTSSTIAKLIIEWQQMIKSNTRSITQ